MTRYNPSHLLRDLPLPNSFTLELKSNSLSPGLKIFSFSLLACHICLSSFLVDKGVIIGFISPFPQLRDLHLPVLSSLLEIHIPSPDSLSVLCAPALWVDDILMGVFCVLWYAHKASCSFNLHVLPILSTVVCRIFLICLLNVSVYPLV